MITKEALDISLKGIAGLNRDEWIRLACCVNSVWAKKDPTIRYLCPEEINRISVLNIMSIFATLGFPGLSLENAEPITNKIVTKIEVAGIKSAIEEAIILLEILKEAESLADEMASK